MPQTDPARECLELLATFAGNLLRQEITLLPPVDAALGWKTGTIHPLQALATEYQGIVRDAVRGETDPDRIKRLESRMLGRFYQFNGAEPALIGVPAGGGYAGQRFPLVEDRLRHAREKLAEAQAIQARLPGEWARTAAPLQAAAAAARSVLDLFTAIPGARGWTVPKVSDAAKRINDCERMFASPTLPGQLAWIYKELKTAVAALADAAAGPASIHMIWFIEPFYLFRLLVRYGIGSTLPISEEDKRRASGELTRYLNQQPWLADWLRDKVVELGRRIEAAGTGGDVLFFLKGGRAIKYLENDPAAGESDWDTQIVINPYLPPARWYALLNSVANTVLLALQAFKAEFYTLLHRHSGEFAGRLATLLATTDLVMQDQDDDVPMMDADDAAETPNCKAELIDVGLPRYDTIEAYEQWVQLNGHILRSPADNISYPGHVYYVAEYLTMLREIFAGVSHSADKMQKRVGRLRALIMLPAVQAIVQQDYAEIPPTLLPQSVAAIRQQAPPVVASMLIVLLKQFAHAYTLAADPGLAGEFDRQFATWTSGVLQMAYPPELAALIAGWRLKPEKPWTADDDAVARPVALAQTVSLAMREHFRLRAAFMAAQRDAIDGFLRMLFDQSIFTQREELEVQLAIDGSYAAALHAGYLRFPRPAELEPVRMVTVGLHTAAEDADPATILALVQPVVQRYAAANPQLFTLIVDAGTPALRLFWTSPQAIPPFTYNPLAVEIVVRRDAQPPLLGFVWGLGVLGLRDLTRQYQQRAAETEEFATRRELRATAAALTEMMTQATDPEPPDPTLAALRRGLCGYLMVSSDSTAVGTGALYPASYPTDQAYRLVLTPNRMLMRDQLRFATSKPRILDLLVINQGHGDIGAFAGWSGDELAAYLVQPLLAIGVSAHVIVLDFCVSASLLEVFAPLATGVGPVIASLYSVNQVIMTTAVWAEIQAPLGQHDLGGILQVLNRRQVAITRDCTGYVQYDRVRFASEQQIAAHLLSAPQDWDAISITRYLPQIGEALIDPDAPAATVLGALVPLLALPTLNPLDAQVLSPLHAMAAVPDPTAWIAVRTALTQGFRQRLVVILTQPAYEIGLDPAEVGQLRVFGPDNCLWRLFRDNRDRLLACAPTLARCPSVLARFNTGSRFLELDAALASPPLDQPTAALVAFVDPQAPQDVGTIVPALKQAGTVSALVGTPGFLQSIR